MSVFDLRIWIEEAMPAWVLLVPFVVIGLFGIVAFIVALGKKNE